MSNEKLSNLESHDDKPPLKEVLSVHEFPEIAFQSYEMLKNNAVAQREAFIADELKNPNLLYSAFGTPANLEAGIARLEEALSISDQYADILGPEGESAVESTLGFRVNEHRLIGLYAALNEATNQDAPEEQVAEIAEETRKLNERLYGYPDPEILNSSLGQLWQTIDNKRLSESATKIREELENGFSWRDAQIPGLEKPEVFEPLPDFNHPALAWAGEIIMNETAPIEAIIRGVWSQKAAEYGDGYEAGPADIAEMFEAALQFMDQDGDSGVKAEIDPDASSLSWDSSSMSIKIGGKRKALDSAEAVYKKFLHEGYIHGGRAINGLKSELPVLGTGLFTDTDRADYLTFEEGFATTVEEAVSGVEPKWNSVNLGHYINIHLASQGHDFRSVFETAWRYRVLDNIKDNQEVDADFINKHKKNAYTACVRIFRGSPTTLTDKYPDIPPVTYNKDLAYLNGRTIAMEYLVGLYENNDTSGLMRLMSAKFDPTVPEQDQLVTKFGIKNPES